MEKISTIQDKSLQISETEWAYADGTPGTITKKCKDKPYEKVVLQTDGILCINPDCQYILNNGLFMEGQMPSNVAIVSGLPTGSTTTKSDEKDDKTPDSYLWEHFEDNDVYLWNLE